MALADVLEKVGEGVEGGVKTVGKVAEALAPVGKAVVNEEAGYAPQIAAESRQHQQALDDAAIGVKAKVLESQLGQLQSNAPLFNNDGSPMTPQQRSAALSGITDQYTQLYSHPRHAPLLMEALRKAVHPNGAVAGPVGAGNPAKAMGGFTAAAPAGAEDPEDAKALKSIDFFKKNMMPLFPPDQQAKKLNEFIDHVNGLKEDAEPKPKAPKIIDQAGSAVGIESPEGKMYTAEMLEKPDSDADADTKSLWNSIKKAQKDKQDQHKADEQEINDRQQKGIDASIERQTRAITNSNAMQLNNLIKAMEIGDYRTAKKEVTKVQEAYDGSLDRADTMEKSYQSAIKGDQQAMTNLLANHIAMTKQQLGTANRSPTRADFEEAAGSLPSFDKLMKQFDSNHGMLSGLTLSKDQMDQMVRLAHEKVGTLKDHLDRVNDEYKSDLNPENPKTGQPLKKGGVANQLKPPASATSSPPTGATHIKKYQRKEYWVDSQGNNLGEKK